MCFIKHILCKIVVYEGVERAGSDVAVPSNRVGLGSKLGGTIYILNLKNYFTCSTGFEVLNRIYGNFKKLRFFEVHFC